AVATWLLVRPAPPVPTPPVFSERPVQVVPSPPPEPAPTATVEKTSLPATVSSGTRETSAPEVAASAATALGLPTFAEQLPKAAPKRSTRVSAAPPPTMNTKPAQCSDILQKAS